MLTRRQLFTTLAGLPFVGRLIPPKTFRDFGSGPLLMLHDKEKVLSSHDLEPYVKGNGESFTFIGYWDSGT